MTGNSASGVFGVWIWFCTSTCWFVWLCSDFICGVHLAIYGVFGGQLFGIGAWGDGLGFCWRWQIYEAHAYVWEELRL